MSRVVVLVDIFTCCLRQTHNSGNLLLQLSRNTNIKWRCRTRSLWLSLTDWWQWKTCYPPELGSSATGQKARDPCAVSQLFHGHPAHLDWALRHSSWDLLEPLSQLVVVLVGWGHGSKCSDHHRDYWSTLGTTSQCTCHTQCVCVDGW